MSADELRGYGRVLVTGFTVFTGLVVFLAESVYREVIENYLKLMFVDEYGYLLVVLISVLTLLYCQLRNVGLSHEVRVGKVIVSILLADLSLIFYVSSLLDLMHATQYGGLSFVLIVLALAILIYNPVTLRDLTPLLSLFILIPLPTSLIDSVTLLLSRLVGKLAAILTGARFIENPAYTQIVVETPSGLTTFNVEIVCTGMAVLSSIIVVIPVIACLVAFSPCNVRRKAAGVFATLALAVLIGLLGSLSRVLLVIWGSSNYSVEAGINLLRYFPSVISSVLSVLIAFFITKKYAGLSRLTPRPSKAGFRVEWGFVVGVLAVLLVFTAVYALTLHYVASPGFSSDEGVLPFRSISIEARELNDFMNNPSKYVFNNAEDLTLTHQVYNDYLTRVLGGLRVYEVGIARGNAVYSGYVEIADTSGRLHTWQLCLTLQGYRVLNSWSRFINGTMTHFIEVEGEVLRGILSYAVIPVSVNTPDGRVGMYVRVSLMRLLPCSSISVASDTASILTELLPNRGRDLSQAFMDTLYHASITSYCLIATLIAYLALVWLSNVLKPLRNLFNSLRKR